MDEAVAGASDDGCRQQRKRDDRDPYSGVLPAAWRRPMTKPYQHRHGGEHTRFDNRPASHGREQMRRAAKHRHHEERRRAIEFRAETMVEDEESAGAKENGTGKRDKLRGQTQILAG